jgi:GT2 family glycosyltransferase
MHYSIAVIVLSYNNFDDTVECIESVRESQYPDLYIVLVDNHSSDGSIQKIKATYPDIHYVDNPRNLGVAGGRNAGWRYIRATRAPDFLLFLDNDTVLQAETIPTLAGYLAANSDAALVCGKTYTAPPSNTIMSAGMSVNLYTGSIRDVGSGEEDVGKYDNPRVVPACGGFAFMLRTAVFDDCNGLDERFNPYGWEDVDFCLRAKQKGHNCHYVPAAVLYHKGCTIGRGYVPLYEKYKVKHFFLLLSRHATVLQKMSCFLFVSARAVAMLSRHVVRGESRLIAPKFSGAYESLFGRKPGK